MKILFSILLVVAWVVGIGTVSTAAAQDIPTEVIDPSAKPLQEYARAVVREVTDINNQQLPGGGQRQTAVFTLELTSGPEKQKVVVIDYDDSITGADIRRLGVGTQLVVAKYQNGDETYYEIVDRYRLPVATYAFICFFVLVIIFGRLKGIGSILGLGFSFFVLLKLVLPRLLLGENPLLVAGVGAMLIAIVSMLLAHGFVRRTYVAIVATVLCLVLAFGISYLLVWAAHLTGLGSESATYIQVGFGSLLNLKGLLLAGMVIATLGVLDDITTAQCAAVEEIAAANKTLTPRELYHRGLSVGREHISSLVNTLVLVYAGGSLPLLVLLSVHGSQPWWVTLNSEFFIEEIVRTLAGSTTLVLAVPIATMLAARFLSQNPVSSGATSHTH